MATVALTMGSGLVLASSATGAPAEAVESSEVDGTTTTSDATSADVVTDEVVQPDGETTEPASTETDGTPGEGDSTGEGDTAGQDEVSVESDEPEPIMEVTPVDTEALSQAEPLSLPLLSALTRSNPLLMGSPEAPVVISDLTVTPQSTTNGDYTTVEVDNNVIMERYHRPVSNALRYAPFVPSAKVTNVPEGAWVWFEFFNESPDVVGTGWATSVPADDLDGDGIYLLRDDWDPRDNSDHSAEVDCVISCSHPDLEPGQTVRFQVRVAQGSTTYAIESRTGICFDHCAAAPAETNYIAIDSSTTLTTNPGADITCDQVVTPPSATEFPLGLVAFCLSVADGSTHEVTLTYDTDLTPSQVTARKYDPADGSSSDIPGAVFTESGTVGVDHQLILTYSITDNGPLDLDPTLGTILDPVGPSAITVTFADQNLEDAVNDELGNPHGTPITMADAATITSLDASGVGITDLTGIEYLTGLTDLRFSNNSITDISPLSGLTSLGILYADRNNITDISPLSDLTNLYGLYLFGNDISDISPLSELAALSSLYASNNSIADISALSDLDNLTFLLLGGNSITDLSPAAGLTNLNYLHAENNDIADISVLAGLTGLTNLWLQNNGITDISALAGMPNLISLRVEEQSVAMPSVLPGAVTANPVVDVAGDPVAVASLDADFTFDAAANEWTFTGLGAKSLTWSTSVMIGAVADVDFSGTISQVIAAAPLVPATAQDPVVVQASCLNGDVVYPQINLATTVGIDYVIEGDVKPGATVIVRATPADDQHSIVVDPGSDWVGNSDHLYATLEIVLDNPACDTPATVIDAPDGDDSDQVETTGHALPKTGGPGAAAGIIAVALIGIGGLLVLSGRTRRQRA